MQFQLDPRSNMPIWKQVVQHIQEQVLRGVLQPGDKLLSVREMSAHLLVNPNTVSKAYQELERLEVIETLRGKGTFISQSPQVNHDPKKIEELQERLRTIVIEASYHGISESELNKWVNQHFQALGGKQNADG
ncbi:GntR family transcriptional regulator [Caldalkalibacillus salinus]|uniref:GntR family transcriptional regulator n=1 Tax=Caldalkalibacillus salinus TaxID=2803787 RepID=UPI0019229EF2|nr:GntR family transcriptional regulator [Caldalkalibacillus salinus]